MKYQLLGIMFINIVFCINNNNKLTAKGKYYRWYWFIIFQKFAILNRKTFASGIILIATGSNFYVVDAKLNKFSIYVIITISLTSLLGVALPYITNKIIADVMKSANIDMAQETTLYIIINLLTAFLVAASFTLTDLESNSKVFSSDFTISIAVWAIAAILGAIIGFIVESKSTPLASQYDSNYDTSGTYDNIK